MNNAINKLKEILENLDSKDDLFNYISFVFSEIDFDINNKPTFIFRKEINWKSLIDQIFNVYLRKFVFIRIEKSIYSGINESFGSPKPNKYASNNLGSSNHTEYKGDIDAFYETGLLSGLFINADNMSENRDERFDTVFLIFVILHEFCHIVRFNYGAKKNHLKWTPYLELEGNKVGEIGEILETLVAVIK